MTTVRESKRLAVGFIAVSVTAAAASPTVLAEASDEGSASAKGQTESAVSTSVKSSTQSGAGVAVGAAVRGEATGSSQALMDMTADTVKGKTITNKVGDELGEVQKVVRGKADQRLYAVVEVGGFLGLGEEQAAVPLDQLQLKGDTLVSTSMQTEGRVKERAERYSEADYEAVPRDQSLSTLGGGTGAAQSSMGAEGSMGNNGEDNGGASSAAGASGSAQGSAAMGSDEGSEHGSGDAKAKSEASQKGMSTQSDEAGDEGDR